MPFIPHTPESLLPRSDSKNPGTTCKGITSSGRPCRRALATSPRSSPLPRASPSAINGVLAVVSTDGDDGAGVEAAAFFCWQHKEQAERLAGDTNGQRAGQKTKVVELKERTSVDTLIDRLGVLEVNDGSPKKAKRNERGGHSRRMPNRKTLPDTWQHVPEPLMVVTEEAMPMGSAKPAKPSRKTHQKSRGQSNLVVSLFCCVRSVDREYLPPPRQTTQSHSAHARRANHPAMEELVSTPSRPPPHTRRRTSSELQNAGHDMPRSTRSNPKPGTSPAQPQASTATKIPTARVPLSPKSAQPINRPRLHRDPLSHTENLLSLIPKTLNPQTASALLSELAKPISGLDPEGYIYMFWLTDAASATPPSSQIASSLLSSPQTRPNPMVRRTSDFLQNFSTSPSSEANDRKTILLKIGRASNVHRRLNEWTRQCNYNLSLIRYYPYIPSLSPLSCPSTLAATDPPTPPLTPRKVPHAHRVERLIHIELAEKRVKKGCEACGKEHREWFEVEASREGIKGVDEVVRRWVWWGEERG